jgi:hypothetical protein
VRDLEELNALLEKRCVEDDARQIQGRDDPRTIDERHERESVRLLPEPAAPYENTKTIPVRISAYPTAQVDFNRTRCRHRTPVDDCGPTSVAIG